MTRSVNSQTVKCQKLTVEAFAPFGDVIEKGCGEQRLINDGNCIRHHDLAGIELAGKEARPVINIFSAKPFSLPLSLRMVERHPLGSQAFMPLHDRPFLVIVCPDENGRPGTPQAFVSEPGQGINFRKNQWHGVLTPLSEPGDFLVVDREGAGNNLEEFHFVTPYLIEQ